MLADHYQREARVIIVASMGIIYAEQMKILRAHAVRLGYPLSLLNSLSILQMLLGVLHMPALMLGLGALERINLDLAGGRYPNMRDLQTLGRAAGLARDAQQRGQV